MKANLILLQRKYARIIADFAEKEAISYDDSLDFFYHSKLYPLLHDGVGDMHCLSNAYLVEELEIEYKNH